MVTVWDVLSPRALPKLAQQEMVDPGAGMGWPWRKAVSCQSAASRGCELLPISLKEPPHGEAAAGSQKKGKYYLVDQQRCTLPRDWAISFPSPQKLLKMSSSCFWEQFYLCWDKLWVTGGPLGSFHQLDGEALQLRSINGQLGREHGSSSISVPDFNQIDTSILLTVCNMADVYNSQWVNSCLIFVTDATVFPKNLSLKAHILIVIRCGKAHLGSVP